MYHKENLSILNRKRSRHGGISRSRGKKKEKRNSKDYNELALFVVVVKFIVFKDDGLNILCDRRRSKREKMSKSFNYVAYHAFLSILLAFKFFCPYIFA